MNYSEKLETIIQNIVENGDSVNLRDAAHRQALLEGVDPDEVDIIIKGRIIKAQRNQGGFRHSDNDTPRSTGRTSRYASTDNMYQTTGGGMSGSRDMTFTSGPHRNTASFGHNSTYPGQFGRSADSSKKKYILIGCAIAVAVAVICGIVYIFSPTSQGEYANANGDQTSIDIASSDTIKKKHADAGENQASSDMPSSDEAPTDDASSDVTTASDNSASNAPSNDDEEIYGDYPEASERLLTDADLASKSKLDLKYMRNEIYARHGYIFKTREMREYFEHQFWYVGEHSDVSSMLTPIEKKNVTLIQKYENR